MRTALEAAAVQAVGKWKFRPAEKDGASVNTTMAIPIVFSIAKPDSEAAKKAQDAARWF
ncbi:Gram-negative bacterial tonB protein [compost metagenome]